MEFTEHLMNGYVARYQANPDELRTFLEKHADFKGSCVVTWSTSSQRITREVKEMMPRLFPEAQSCDPRFEGGNGVQLPDVMEAAVLYGSLALLFNEMKTPGDSFKVRVHGDDGTPIIPPKIK